MKIRFYSMILVLLLMSTMFAGAAEHTEGNSGDVIPYMDSKYYLGTKDNRWRSVYSLTMFTMNIKADKVVANELKPERPDYFDIGQQDWRWNRVYANYLNAEKYVYTKGLRAEHGFFPILAASDLSSSKAKFHQMQARYFDGSEINAGSSSNKTGKITLNGEDVITEQRCEEIVDEKIDALKEELMQKYHIIER